MMDHQVIDAAGAQALHVDACRAHPLVGWVIWHDHPAYPGRYTAQLVTTGPLPYLLTGDTLAAVQEQLPFGLVRMERQPVHPPEAMEMWLAE